MSISSACSLTTAVEDKILIISHCTASKEKSNLRWNLLCRSDQKQYFGANHGNSMLAIYSAPNKIELWDMSSSPAALSFLNVPVTRINVDTYVENECHCIAWSFHQDYLIATFGSRRKLDTGAGKIDLHLWDISDGSIMTSYRLDRSLQI
jgi:WD40 repeat protein